MGEQRQLDNDLEDIAAGVEHVVHHVPSDSAELQVSPPDLGGRPQTPRRSQRPQMANEMPKFAWMFTNIV